MHAAQQRLRSAKVTALERRQRAVVAGIHMRGIDLQGGGERRRPTSSPARRSNTPRLFCAAANPGLRRSAARSVSNGISVAAKRGKHQRAMVVASATGLRRDGDHAVEALIKLELHPAVHRGDSAVIQRRRMSGSSASTCA